MADLFIFDDNKPVNPSIGQHWIQPSQGQDWVYLNNNWSPVTGGEIFDFENPISIFISGTLLNSNIRFASFNIKNIITEQIDTCAFTLENDGDSSVNPELGEQVDVFEFATNTKIFGGEIAQFTQSQQTPGNHNRFIFEVSCTDFTKRLNKRLAVKEYTNQKAGDIIKDLVDTYATEFSYANVEDGPTIDFISFNYKKLDECIKKLAKLSGYSWYVDYIKDIHFFLPSTEFAPYTLTEDETSSGHFKELTFTQDKTRYRNTVFLQSSGFLEQYDNDIREADGEKLSFNLSYEPYDTVQAFVDTGSGFISKTVGIDNVDTSGFDFVVNRSEKTIRNLDLAKLNFGDVLKVTYKKRVRLILTDNDATAISDTQAREGGDGIYEYKFSDDTIDNIDTGRDANLAILRDYKNPIITGSFISDQNGYKAGQILQMNLPNWGYANKEYEIHDVTIEIASNPGIDDRAYVRYTIVFGTLLRGWQEFIFDIYNDSTNKEIIVKGDEKLTN